MNMFAVASTQVKPTVFLRPQSPAMANMTPTPPLPGSPFAVATNRVKPCWLMLLHASATTEMMTYLRLRSQSPATDEVIPNATVPGSPITRGTTMKDQLRTAATDLIKQHGTIASAAKPMADKLAKDAELRLLAATEILRLVAPKSTRKKPEPKSLRRTGPHRRPEGKRVRKQTSNRTTEDRRAAGRACVPRRNL